MPWLTMPSKTSVSLQHWWRNDVLQGCWLSRHQESNRWLGRSKCVLAFQNWHIPFFISFVSGISTVMPLLFIGKVFHDWDKGEWRGTGITLLWDQDAAGDLVRNQSFYLYILFLPTMGSYLYIISLLFFFFPPWLKCCRVNLPAPRSRAAGSEL